MDNETPSETPDTALDTGDPLARVAPVTKTPPVPQAASVSRTEPVSRRDFLKRASRDAVQTGAAFVPGAGIARAVLGTTGSDTETRKPSLMERFAKWRNEHNPANAAPADARRRCKRAGGQVDAPSRTARFA